MSDEGEVQHRRGREATTAAILEAAQELFSEHGYTAVSVRDIAERAGVSHALVHRYLGSKADIFLNCAGAERERHLGGGTRRSRPAGEREPHALPAGAGAWPRSHPAHRAVGDERSPL